MVWVVVFALALDRYKDYDVRRRIHETRGVPYEDPPLFSVIVVAGSVIVAAVGCMAAIVYAVHRWRDYLVVPVCALWGATFLLACHGLAQWDVHCYLYRERGGPWCVPDARHDPPIYSAIVMLATVVVSAIFVVLGVIDVAITAASAVYRLCARCC